MSYQFEDDSALEELLNQQLDRRKQQQQLGSSAKRQTQNATRPTTGGASQSIGQVPNIRPSTATSSGPQRMTDKLSETYDSGGADHLATSLPSGGRTTLSNWLQGASKQRLQQQQQQQQQQEKVASSGRVPTVMRFAADAAIGSAELKPARKLSMTSEPIGDQADRASRPLDDLLAPASLQDMSKQRLIQVILEEVKPRLSLVEGSLGRDLARDREQLERALQFERNRLEAIEMRHGEMLELEREKWLQINQQLESRLQSDERQMEKLLEDQRNHLALLSENYQKQLDTLNKTASERIRLERARFDEMLRERDEMHKLELEAKLGVDCNLNKLNAVQLDWRRTLELTIRQLSEQYKAIEAQLERQALLVNGSNSELASKTKMLCDHYDNYHNNQRELARLAAELAGLLAGLAQAEHRAETTLEGADDRLAKLDSHLGRLAEGEKQLASSRRELDELRAQSLEDKFKLALDASRLSMKEERLDELLASNAKLESELTNERKSLQASQTQANSRRLALDERFAELKEQNYALHLLRKRLIAEREELVKAQLELAEERKTFKSSRSQVEEESKRLETLKVRVQRELDQLRRLQKSLVCSLCLSRLFGEMADGGANESPPTATRPERITTTGSSNRPSLADTEIVGRAVLDRLGTTATMRVELDPEGGRRRRPRRVDRVKDNDDEELAAQLRRTQLNESEIAAENKHIEELVGTELL